MALGESNGKKYGLLPAAVGHKTKAAKKPPAGIPAASDTAGARGIPKANRYKASPKSSYLPAVRAGYKAGSTASRQQQATMPATTPEQKAAAQVHGQRVASDARTLARIGYLPRVQRSEAAATAAAQHKEAAARAVYAKWYAKHIGKVSDVNEQHQGLGLSLLQAPAKMAAGAVTSAAALEDATYHDPVSVPIKTAKQAVQAIPASLAGVYDLARHPIKTTKQIASSEQHDLNSTFEGKVKRIRKEGGFQDLSDIATVVVPDGGAIAKLAPDVERAALRTSGGIVAARDATKATLPNVLGKAIDTVKARRLQRDLDAARAGEKPMDAVRYKAALANEKAGRTVEVVPRRAGAKQIVDVAKQKGRAVYGLKHDQGTRVHAAAKTINKLDKSEQRAFHYSTVFGIRTPEQARALLPQLRDSIIAKRAAHGVKVTGSLKRSDMLPDIEKMLAAPEKHFTPKLAASIDALREDSLRAGREDPSLVNASTRVQRRYAPIADLLGVHRGPAETLSSHIGRIHNAMTSVGPAVDGGLARPLYFKSERYTGPTDFASRAVGGKRAMAHDRVYAGKNLEVGLQDTTPAQYLRGLSRNIKRKHNWDLVANILDSHAIKGLAPAGGSTIKHLRASIHQAGIDENSIAYWNPGVFHSHAKIAMPPSADDRFADLDESAGIKSALGYSTVAGRSGTPTHLQETSGWQVIPAKAMHELEAQSKPSGAFGRSADIVKGKSSRAILLAGNLPWAQFQVASNALVTTAATGGRALNPANWLGAAKWWHALSPEEQRNVGSHLGLDTSNADMKQTRLGASTNNDLVNTYRAIKAHPLFHTGVIKGHGPSISELNPMELMARFDRTQNNLHRTVAGYTMMKHEAVKRMGQSMGAADKAQLKITHILAMPPIKQLKAMAHEKPLLEAHAERVADWLGDYTTMTARERHVLNRTVMFYPYLRYSLKLVFYTLPVKHPAVTAILAELGTMHANEIKKLFGSSELPWDSGKIYFGSGGHIKSIDLKRANPALNALFDVTGSKNYGQLIGLFPPYAEWATDWATHRNNYADRDWRVNGAAAPYGPKSADYGTHVRLRVLAKSISTLAFPIREAQNLTQSGTQGDDSLLFSSRPTHFKGKDTTSKLKAKFAKRDEAFDQKNGSLLHDLVPFIPTPNHDKQESAEQAIITKSELPKHKSKTAYFGAGSIGGLSPTNLTFGSN